MVAEVQSRTAGLDLVLLSWYCQPLRANPKQLVIRLKDVVLLRPKLGAAAGLVDGRLLGQAIKLSVFVEAFGIRLAACTYCPIGTKILMHSGHFIANTVSIGHHLAMRAKRFISCCEGWMAILQNYGREFAALGSLPVLTGIEHSLHFRG